MPDLASTPDTQKTPSPESPHISTDGTKVSDSTAQKNDGGHEQSAVSWMMSEVHSQWDSLKTAVGIAPKTEAAATNGALQVTDIFHGQGQTTSPEALVAASGADKAAATGEKTATSTGDKPATATGDKLAASGSDITTVVVAAEAAPAHHWWDRITEASHAVASYVEKGWDSLSDTVGDSYKSILGDSDNKTSQVEAKIGSDGKPQYFKSQSDNGTRTLTADEQRFTDAKGGTIIKDIKTGQITSQSADGEDIYTRKADGTEIYRSKNIEYTKTADGKYEARDDKGNLTEVSDKGSITQIDGAFKVAQRITSIDATRAKPEKGQIETMIDGQRYMDHQGNLVVARDNGVREITTKDGQHFRLDRGHKKLEIEENGQWRSLTKEEFEKFHQCHMGHDGHGHNSFEVNGVKIDADGKVSTADKATVGQILPDGKMTATLPTNEGKQAVIVNNPDHTSTLDFNGHITKVNPEDKTHLVERFSENPDGSQGASEFCYDSDNQSFWTPDLQWDQNGTHLGWNDTFIDLFGSVTSADGSSIFDSSPDATQSSSTQSDQSCRSAVSAIAAVTSKIGSQSLDSGDVAILTSSLGDLDGALTVAMSCGNFSAACQIIEAKGTIATALAEATQQVALSTLMRSNNMTEGDIVSACDEVDSRGVLGAAVSQKVLVHGPNVQTFEGRLAYMSQFGISGLTEDQERRLTA